MSTSQEPVKPIGKFCAVIQRQLAVTNCPLPKGTCVWKHRVTGQCRYDPKNSDMTIIELANLVGESIPTEVQLLETKANLLSAIKVALKE